MSSLPKAKKVEDFIPGQLFKKLWIENEKTVLFILALSIFLKNNTICNNRKGGSSIL